MGKPVKYLPSETAERPATDARKRVYGYYGREPIPVTQPYLPDRAKLERYLDGIFDRNWHTNNGPLVRELTDRLKDYLGVDNLLVVSNGTLALQVAYRALGLNNEVDSEAITTPYSFVATTSTLKWEGIKPVFADIDSETFCVAPNNILRSISERTKAVVPVHLFGNSCDVEKIEDISDTHGLKTVYDGAHAFGIRFKGKSLLNWGDATTLSFHATKLFHTCEGGAIVFRNKQDFEKARLLINFGIEGLEKIGPLGINAKMSEIHAAVGLCILDDIDNLLDARAEACHAYERMLGNYFRFPKWNPDATRNYAYFPVLFETERELLQGRGELEKLGIGTRRYFYPTLDTLQYLQPQPSQPVAHDIAERVLCLPLPAPGMDLNAIRNSLKLPRA